MYNRCMIRINAYITDYQHKQVTKQAKVAGIKFSEMLRRLLDEKLRAGKNGGKEDKD